MADADSWDAENFEVDEPVGKATGLDRWEGEDEDEDIKDNWDDDEEEKQVKEKKPEVKSEVAEKKKLSAKIKEKEKKEQEQEHKAPIVKADLTPEEQAADKLRAKQLQEEADLELAKDAFGVPNNVPVVSAAVTRIDTLSPSSKDDFTELQKLLKEKISPYESSVHYSSFLESLFRDLCISLEVEDLKKISNSLTVLLSEKQKQEKQNKAKKKKKGVLPAGGLKAKLKDDLADYGDFEGGYTQDYEDFM
ncbi:hypothetical protein SKAU_G00353760 [Synaphobranchus kaupii]|uniref:Eukaryotic translation initiation factor 3 subunit J n=1 Tax=Synaphobranchus kaupii TaxID=118154 RepID=A0A9Q1EL32_SYNKA|nr:hypothetical protein SKAU_G00353760 [Synaphobranchus kaupii]